MFPYSGYSPGTFGDGNFRGNDAEVNDTDVRYGFRMFGIYNRTERKTIQRPGKPTLRGPLRLSDDLANGTLRGPFRSEYHYGPGLNVATCFGGTYGPVGPGPRIAKHRAPFVMHDEACKDHDRCRGRLPCRPHGCGFYAYGSPTHKDADPTNAPVNSYSGHRPMFVQAVVQCSGRRLLGKLGFLSEKLRIVAMALPIECTTLQGDDVDAFDLYESRLERLITANYPDVATFPSVRQMLAEFPLTPLPS